MSWANVALVEQEKWCDKFVFSKVMCSITWSRVNLAHWPAVAVMSLPGRHQGEGWACTTTCAWPPTPWVGHVCSWARRPQAWSCWALEHGHSPYPSILPAWVWPQPWAGAGLAVQTHVLRSLGSSLLEGCLPLFLLECVPCSGGYHDRDAAAGLLPLRGYNVSWAGDTSLQKQAKKGKPAHWIFTNMASPHCVTSWENPRAQKTCQYASLIGLDRMYFCVGPGFPLPAGTVTGHSWRSAAKAWLAPCQLLLDNVLPWETPCGLALLWVGWWTRWSPEVPSNLNWFLAGSQHVGNRGQSRWVLTAHFLSEQWEECTDMLNCSPWLCWQTRWLHWSKQRECSTSQGKGIGASSVGEDRI